MKLNRRKFLTITGLSAVGGVVGYAYVRGVRYPVLQFTPDAAPTTAQQNGIDVQAHGALFQRSAADGVLEFRAFVPEPRLDVRVSRGSIWQLAVENIHPEATLSVDSTSHRWREQRDNLTRTISGEGETDASLHIQWKFPESNTYRFTIIGDTGGGTELDWVLQRSVELGADFILHLGDLNYDEGDLERAAIAFNKAIIPSFVAVGNHDFRDGLQHLYKDFTRLIGPLNSAFRLGGIQFLNLDTATDYWPPQRGARMHLLEQFPIGGPDVAARDSVVFMHRPPHGINGPGEADWLRKQLLDRGMNTLVAGHFHIKEERNEGGLHTYVSGQGLAHADLIVGRPIAEILVADVEPGKPVQYHWAPLNMQLEAHCNLRNWGVLEVLDKPHIVEQLKEVCKKAGVPGE